MRSLKSLAIVWLPALLALFLVQQLSANPLKCPRRLINNQTVDLDPLFKWWTNHAGARPLTGWAHITGTIVGTNSWGWVVEGKAEGANKRSLTKEPAEPAATGAVKILLLHPPLQDLAEFDNLKAELLALNSNRKQFVDQETQTKNQAQALAKEQKSLGRNYPQARALSQEAKQLNLASERARTDIKLLDLQILPLKNKLATYPDPDGYLVDCFALDTGRETQALSVYDHGSVFQ